MNSAVAVLALLTIPAARQLEAAKKDVRPDPTAEFYASHAEADTWDWRESLRANLARMPVDAAACVLATVSSRGNGVSVERQY